MPASTRDSGPLRSPEMYFCARHQLDRAGHLILRKYDRPGVELAEYRRDRADFGFTTRNPVSDAYMAVVKLNSFHAHNMWCDGRHITSPRAQSGAFALFDLRHSWCVELIQPFHTVNFFVAQAALDELTDEIRAPRIDALRFDLTNEQRDDVMFHLALALLPALNKPWEINKLFADHVTAAAGVHLAQTYGGLKPWAARASGGLSPGREKLAKEMLIANLCGEISLHDLAKACGLSSAHFARAFRQTTGKPPHRWLLEQRVERAKDLLLRTNTSIAQIASACGFVDQSHFTRAFSRHVGSTPGAWRDARRN
jgi:AraC family transcriptional regulator